jgi:hypothetical protein
MARGLIGSFVRLLLIFLGRFLDCHIIKLF